MLKLTNIIAGYGGGDVLKGVDLEVEKGTLTCIVGPNGAGKSTVLRVISGLLKPRLGTITFLDRSIGARWASPARSESHCTPAERDRGEVSDSQGTCKRTGQEPFRRSAAPDRDS